MNRGSKIQPGIDPREAAYREAGRDLANAWKSEFQQDLQRAASYLPTTKPHTESDRRAVVDLIESLKKLLLGCPTGRPRPGGPISRSEFRRRLIPVAELTAVRLVRERKKFWREENNRQRVPASLTTKMISETIKQVAFQLSIPATKISSDEVSRLVSKK